MLMETPETLSYVAFGVLLLGWFVGKIGAYFGNRLDPSKQDPRDFRIRSLEADHRVAQTQINKTQANFEVQSKAMSDARGLLAERDQVIDEQADVISGLRAKLKSSVKKTKQLRGDLSDQATEGIKSEVRLRDVETELSVVHAATEMISTGILDFSDAPEETTPPKRRVSSKG